MGLSINFHVFEKKGEKSALDFAIEILHFLKFDILEINPIKRSLDDLEEEVLQPIGALTFAIAEKDDLVIFIDQEFMMRAGQRPFLLKELSKSKANFILSSMNGDTVNFESTIYYKDGMLIGRQQVAEGKLLEESPNLELYKQEVSQILNNVKCGYQEFYDLGWIAISALG